MRISVSATSANLGPGFDCFGIAWQSRNEIFFEQSNILQIEGCPAEYANKDNLAWQGYKRVLEHKGIKPEGAYIRFGKTHIPVCRGLGSSAALCVAGAAAADALYKLGLGREGIFEIATAVEGHPDNASPAVFGGLSASFMAGERPVTVAFPVHESYCFTALIPNFPLSTALARSVLPPVVERGDAIFNVSHAAVLLHALESGDGEILRLAMEDRLHQPYRYPLIPGSEVAIELATECGALGVCISGAGPTLLCVSKDKEFAQGLSEKMSHALPLWEVRELHMDHKGVVVEP